MYKSAQFLKAALIFTLTISIGFSSICLVSYADEADMTDTHSSKELGLENVEVKSFKIIDISDGNKEIEYLESSSPDYDHYKSDPSKFKNAVCENQKNSKIKLKLSIEYSGDNIINEGDTLTVPASHGGTLQSFTNRARPVEWNGNVLGNCIYENGNFVLTFSGDYIKNNKVKQFSAYFETGEMTEYSLSQKKTTVLGEKTVKSGKLGKNSIIVPFEKYYIKSSIIGQSYSNVFKGAIKSNDQHISWALMLRGDYKTIGKDAYFNPFLLENDGNYNRNTLTDIYIEDTFSDTNSAPELEYVLTWLSGIDDSGNVISGFYSIQVPKNLFNEIKQGSKNKNEIKSALKSGQYCIYDNNDGTFTFMMKWWDMDKDSGLTYNDIPEISKAGGAGNYLKNSSPDIFGNFSEQTISKINRIYNGKAVQNVDIRIKSTYVPVKETTEIKNTAIMTTGQTGTVEKTAVGKLTPMSSAYDDPKDPSTIKLIKSDKDTGASLSESFSFYLQTSSDEGKSWANADLNAAMVETGTFNKDSTVTPNHDGIVQIKGLVSGNIYRFIERTHAEGYENTVINESRPNDRNNTGSANSKAVKITDQGKGHVINMYNAKEKSPFMASYSEEYYKEDKDGAVRYSDKNFSLVSEDTKKYQSKPDIDAVPVNNEYEGFKLMDVTFSDSVNPEAKTPLKVNKDNSLVIRHYYSSVTPSEKIGVFPKTGDTSYITVYFLLLGISTAVLISLIKKRLKQKDIN